MSRPALLGTLCLLACGGTGASDSGSEVLDCSLMALEIPSGRGELQGGWDSVNKRLVVFGGNQAVPVNCAPGATDFVGQTWAWSEACESFVKLQPEDKPKSRGRFAAASDGTQLIVHGGRFRDGDSGTYTLYGDTWSFDYATEQWSRLAGPGGTAPEPRFDHAAIIADGAFWLMGGNTSADGANLVAADDTWRFDLTTDKWEQVSTTNNPPPRLYHAATTDGSTLYAYGGGDEGALFGAGFHSDLWALDLASGAWTELHSGGSSAPAGRIWPHIAWDEAGSRLLLFGGHDDGALGNNNELWQFKPGSGNWKQLSAGDTFNNPALGVCDFPEDFTVIDPSAPERRSAAAWAVTDAGELVVFGGKTDCGNANDVWSLDLASDTWALRSKATEGEVCLRAFQDCSSMCF